MKKKEEAIKELLFDSGRATADAAAELLLKKPELLSDFAALAFSNEYPFDMRSSNVIEKADELQRGFAAVLIPQILEKMSGFKNDGPKRQFLRMLIRYVREMDEDHTGMLYDLCFGFSCDPGQSVAIRHNSLQVLNRLCKRYPELKPEIAAALELRVIEESGPFGRWLREFIQSLRS